MGTICRQGYCLPEGLEHAFSHKFAFRWLQTKRQSPGKHGSSPQMNCFLAVNESLILEVTGQMVDTVGKPSSKIPI